MAFQIDTYSCNPWISRIDAANKAYDAWEAKFNCRRLNDYYENFQWKGRTDGPMAQYRPYTLNLFHSTIKIKMASFLFQKPEFMVTPEPGHSHWNLEQAVAGAQIKQDTLNTIVRNKNTKFARTIKRAALDSFFWFSMIEVGYAADWRNPLKDDPYLNSWDDPDKQEDQIKVREDREVPVNERFFVKRIKPWRFRVSCSDAEDLEEHEWVGYYQYYFTDSLRKTKGIKFPENYDGGQTFSGGSPGAFSKDPNSGLFIASGSQAKVSKVWHIWDLVTRERKLILDGYDDEDFELWSQEFERLPLIDNRWDLRVEGYYPIPPAWYWLSSQDEINESREQIRSYRRRFTRKFQMVKDAVDEEEIEKFVSGPDGIVIEVKQKDAISAIENPEIGPTSENALIQAKDDFNLVSGTSAEARGQNADRETATQAQIINQRSQIRESAEQLDFTDFVGQVGSEILAQASEKLNTGLWVKYSSSIGGAGQDMQINAPNYKYITSQDLSDGYDAEVRIDVKNATPQAMQQEQAAYVNFVMFLQNAPMVALSPILIRETAYRFGYKNEEVIHQMQQVALLHMAAQASQAGASGQQIQQAATGNNSANTAKAQMAQPSQEQIGTQLQEQL